MGDIADIMRAIAARDEYVNLKIAEAIKNARNAALEEAAKVADAYEPRCDVCPRGVAAAIRALIKEPQEVSDE